MKTLGPRSVKALNPSGSYDDFTLRTNADVLITLELSLRLLNTRGCTALPFRPFKRAEKLCWMEEDFSNLVSGIE